MSYWGSKDQEGLDHMVRDIEAEGGSAVGRLVNAVEPGAIEGLVKDTEAKSGPIAVVVFNLGAQIGTRSLAATSLKQFELGWRMACLGLFRAAQAAMPAMVQNGKGCFLVTSSTAAMRGNEGQHSHAAAMGGRRMLCQSLNAEFGPRHGLRPFSSCFFVCVSLNSDFEFRCRQGLLICILLLSLLFFMAPKMHV